jgi:hypothetical protein
VRSLIKCYRYGHSTNGNRPFNKLFYTFRVSTSDKTICQCKNSQVCRKMLCVWRAPKHKMQANPKHSVKERMGRSQVKDKKKVKGFS